MLRLMYVTNDPKIAVICDKCGVDRVWVDLEYLGKEKRQAGMNTVKSNHTEEDVLTIGKCLKNAQLMVRVNPINKDSKREIDSVIDKGAKVVMLPYYKTNDEVKTFIDYLGGRATAVLLLETKEAFDIVDETLKIKGIDEIHIGLNDLHLSYGLSFMFELVSNGKVEELCKKFKAHNIPYGFGGIAKLGEGLVPAEYIIAEHYRLGSTGAILSRSFYDTVNADDYPEIEKFFTCSMAELRDYEKQLESKDEKFFTDNKNKLYALIEKVAKERRLKK